MLVFVSGVIFSKSKSCKCLISTLLKTIGICSFFGYFVDAVKAGADAKDLVKMNEEATAKYLEAEYEKAWKTARERGPQPASEDEVKAAEEPDAATAPAE